MTYFRFAILLLIIKSEAAVLCITYWNSGIFLKCILSNSFITQLWSWNCSYHGLIVMLELTKATSADDTNLLATRKDPIISTNRVQNAALTDS